MYSIFIREILCYPFPSYTTCGSETFSYSLWPSSIYDFRRGSDLLFSLTESLRHAFKVPFISSVISPTLLGVLLVLLYFVFISSLSVLDWIKALMVIVQLPLVPSTFWTTQSKTRAAPGPFRSSITSLQVGSNVLPLDFRRELLAVKALLPSSPLRSFLISEDLVNFTLKFSLCSPSIVGCGHCELQGPKLFILVESG